MKRLTSFGIIVFLAFVSFGEWFGASANTSLALPLVSPASTTSVRGADITLALGQLTSEEANSQEGRSSVTSLDAGVDGTFTSVQMEAPIPFTHVGIRYLANIPEGSIINWEIRGSIDGTVWTKWYPVEDDDDIPIGKDGKRTTQVFGLREKRNPELLRFVQARATLLRAASGEVPSIKLLNMVFIDPTLGPVTQSAPASSLSALNTSQWTPAMTYKSYLPLIYKQDPPTPTPTPTPTSTPTPPTNPKPVIISRNGWACPDGESSPAWRPEYQTVTHIIVHHTATANDVIDWAEEVRVIWYYHTYQVPNSDGTYGWGDIGYNYLIDPNGFIYEGRAGGDDVVGGHALRYNWGSLGVALLGNYGSTYPSSAAQNSLVNLLSWKAQQRGINPLLMSSYFVDKYVPTVMGHRDVLSTTCPGQGAYYLLPQIRQLISNRLTGSTSP